MGSEGDALFHSFRSGHNPRLLKQNVRMARRMASELHPHWKEDSNA